MERAMKLEALKTASPMAQQIGYMKLSREIFNAQKLRPMMLVSMGFSRSSSVVRGSSLPR